ncbi:MAG: hypothetical protein DLM53_03885 [Candidatus Eremiobacter antarcticus]|nr:MAG: hypothetical protein DLM53_03885 [Candidatus Eremiobacter sp. RRmetagenome_bin22]
MHASAACSEQEDEDDAHADQQLGQRVAAARSIHIQRSVTSSSDAAATKQHQGKAGTDLRLLHHHSIPSGGQVKTEPRPTHAVLQKRRSTSRESESLDKFFNGPTIDVAKRLIGATLYRRVREPGAKKAKLLTARIVETEAYLPLIDPSCHAYRGPTARTSTLFGRPGFAYVYLIYGMHYCLNVTTEPPGIGAAVLIRSAEPLAAIEAMQGRRGEHVPIAALASGPGNLCRAMSIGLECDGANFRQGDLIITPASQAEEEQCKQHLGVSARIGLNVAERWPLRFYDARSASISPFRKSSLRAVKRTRNR